MTAMWSGAHDQVVSYGFDQVDRAGQGFGVGTRTEVDKVDAEFHYSFLSVFPLVAALSEMDDNRAWLLGELR